MNEVFHYQGVYQHLPPSSIVLPDLLQLLVFLTLSFSLSITSGSQAQATSRMDMHLVHNECTRRYGVVALSCRSVGTLTSITSFKSFPFKPPTTFHPTIPTADCPVASYILFLAASLQMIWYKTLTCLSL